MPHAAGERGDFPLVLMLRERYPKPDDENAIIPGVPDLAVKVLSPSERPGMVVARSMTSGRPARPLSRPPVPPA